MRPAAVIFAALAIMAMLSRAAMPASQGYFNFEGDATDLSGNDRDGTLVGAGPDFVSSSPSAVARTYCASNFTDANYVTIPTTVFTDSMANSGTIKYSIYYRASDIGGNKLPYRSEHSGGACYIEWSSNVTLLMPTTTGGQVAVSGATTRREGRWYTIYICWDTTGLDVYIEDVYEGSFQHPINKHPLDAGYPKFNAASQVLVGRASGDGYSFQGAVDNLEFYDTCLFAETRELNVKRFVYTFGHSWVQGTGSTHADGYRRRFYQEVCADGRISFDFWGTYKQGTLVCPYTNGVSGHTSAQVLDDLNQRLPEVMLTPNTKTYLMLGPVSLTDIIYSRTAEVYKASMQDCLNTINAYSPLIKTFLITQNPSTEYGSVTPYVAADYEIVDWAQAQGWDVSLIDSQGNVEIHLGGLNGTDYVHPDDEGYETLGAFIAGKFLQALFPAAMVRDKKYSTFGMPGKSSGLSWTNFGLGGE